MYYRKFEDDSMGKKILVIDDEESTRELLKLSLEADGYEVRVAEDGYRGLEIFEEFKPEIVLTDIKMPGLDGIEVLQRLKETGEDVEVIVITGHGEMNLAIKALQLEASDFINKPISDLALSVALKRAKEKIWMRRKLNEYVRNLEEKLKDAVEEINKRHDFEHKLIETSIDGIIANDRKGNILIFNEGASRIYGYTKEEAIHQLHVTKLYPEGEAKRIKKKIYSDEYGGPGRLVNYETTAVTKDNRLVPILLSATLIYEDGTEVATVGYFKDLSEIKKLQQELVQRERMAAIGEAMSEVAHGVKNILYGMKLGAYMVDKGMNSGNLEKAQKGWSLVKKNIDRISRLSLDMLSYAKKDTKERKNVCLNDVIEEICELVKQRMEKEGITLIKNLQEGLPELHLDLESIHACILNLVTNAIEAFPDSKLERKIEIRTRLVPGEHVCIDVIDNGRGITDEIKKKIFSPLFTTKGAHGTGLGLAIAEKIVKEHGGFIEVKSRLNEGSHFTVFLPINSKQ